MRSVAEHRTAVLDLVRPLPATPVPVGSALGLVLAEDVVAAVDLPGFDNSAMDGYAVRAAELAGASPQTPVALPVDGDVAAGDTTHHVLRRGTALRIMTGAPMPDGADTVVPVELTDGGAARVELHVAPELGRSVRRRGEDVRAGDRVLPAGTRLGPGHLALAAAGNVAEVVVHRRPRVAVVSTGDELVDAGVGARARADRRLQPRHALRARRGGGGRRRRIGAPARRRRRDARLPRRPPGDPDLVLTTGGVSMGVYDTVKEVLTADGGVEFVKVAMRPGMPQGCGVVGRSRTPVVTLPGNPVSSFVSFHVFVLPALRRLAGLDPDDDGSFEAVAEVGWGAAPGKVELTRVVESAAGVRPSGGQGSHVLGALAGATALALVPADVDRVVPGLRLRCIPLLGQDRPRVH